MAQDYKEGRELFVTTANKIHAQALTAEINQGKWTGWGNAQTVTRNDLYISGPSFEVWATRA